MSARTLSELKEEFGAHLSDPNALKRPEGIATGMSELDRFLFWHGIPKGALTLFQGALGTGATSLWVESALRTVQAGRWVVWVNRDVPLSPLPLKQKGLNLGHLVSVEAPESDEKLFWLLQELMSASLFDLLACDLGERQLKEHQLRKLQAQARTSNVALVFLSQSADRRSLRKPRGSFASIYSLIINFEKTNITVERALHRQTPHIIERGLSHARFIR